MEDLRKFFEIFNAVLFNGVLTGYERDLHWYERTIQGGELGYCRLLLPGYEMDPRFRLEYPLGSIWIKKGSTQRDPTAKIEEYLETLVHEMLHALFFIYACSCKNGCAEKLYDAVYRRWKGHCASWQAAAYAIERASKLLPLLSYSSVAREVSGWKAFERRSIRHLGNLALWHLFSLFSAGKSKIANWMIAKRHSQVGENGLLGMNLWLGRTDGFAFDIQQNCGASIPAESELDRLGLSLKYIKTALAEFNTRQALRQKTETRKQQLRLANRCLRDWWIVDKDVEVTEECGSVDADKDDGDDTA